MDCTQEELQLTNVFRSSVFIPLIKILDMYMSSKREPSPDEFCILLFARNEVQENDKLITDPVDLSIENLDQFEIPPVSVQAVIIDLFMNIIRYDRILETVSKDFLDQRNCRTYANLHELMALIYSLVYRILALSFEESVECFVHFKISKMLGLVTYLLQEDTLNLFYKTACSVFEEDFVEQKLMLPFLEATPSLEKLHARLREQKQKMKIPRKEVTVPLCMNVLNRPKTIPKVPPPTPDVSQNDLTVIKYPRAIPKTNYSQPAMEMKLASLRVANKLQAIDLLNEANKSAPSCSLRRKDSSKFRKKFEQPVTVSVRKSVPTFKPVQVKQTTASILRECARIVNDETKEIRKLKELSEGGLDPRTILKLEEEKRRQEKEMELIKIQEKHLTALLTREGAFIAKQSLLNDIKLHAENVRKEKQELYEKLEKLRQDHNKEMVEIVEKCREIEQASREAFNSMIDEKRQKAAEVSEESRQLKALLVKQREEEMQRKIQLIQEIKTIQLLRSLPFKDFDPTESSGLGLLCEMSLAELKERLFWTKMKLNEEIESRKTVINRGRKRQKNLIKETQRALEEYKASRRSIPPSKVQPDSATVTSPEIEALRKKLDERRSLRHRN